MGAEVPVTGHDGDLVRRARLKMVPKMSIRKAAALTGDDPGNWGIIERGYQDLGGKRGRRIVMQPPPETLARMSSVVGVTPAQWEARGRGDVAELLEGILEDSKREAGAVTAAMAAADEAFMREIRNSPDLPEEQKALYLRLWSAGSRGKVAEIAAQLARRINGD